MSSPLLRAHQLSRRFGRHAAVTNLDLTLARGEVLGLLGLNGAGKSTTLQMLGGVLAPDTGTVEINGHDLARAPRAARRDLGYLPQIPPLFDEARVEEFLRFCGELRGLSGDTLRRAVDRTLERCGLLDARTRLIRNLSGGLRQRVGIAQAIVHDPVVVILDEPSAGLDPAQTQALRVLVAGLREHHAVLLSTHLLGEVEAVCTRVVILHEGRLIHEEVLAGTQAWAVLALAAPPSRAAFASRAGGVPVDELEPGRFAFPLPSDLGLLGDLLSHAASHWQAREFTIRQSRLEHLFAALVRDTPARPE